MDWGFLIEELDKLLPQMEPWMAVTLYFEFLKQWTTSSKHSLSHKHSITLFLSSIKHFVIRLALWLLRKAKLKFFQAWAQIFHPADHHLQCNAICSNQWENMLKIFGWNFPSSWSPVNWAIASFRRNLWCKSVQVFPVAYQYQLVTKITEQIKIERFVRCWMICQFLLVSQFCIFFVCLVPFPLSS